MKPELPVNCLIFVQKVDPSEISEGDIITFVINEKGTLATHRVQEKDTKSRIFITKGDANNNADSPVEWNNVVGKVKFKIPGIGKFFEVVTSSENRSVIVVAIAILVVCMFASEYVIRLIRKKRLEDSVETEDKL